MATVNLGRIKPVFRGAFNNSTAYVIDDIVTSGNETFIAIAATQGNATTDASKWTKLAAKGADGTDVAATLANKEIAFKTNAGALDGIPIGSAGEFLKVNSGATGYEYGAVSSNLVKLASGTISSSVSALELDHFSSTYKLYKMYINKFRPASNENFRLRMRSGGSNDTSGYYDYITNHGMINSGSSTSFNNHGQWDSGHWGLSGTNDVTTQNVRGVSSEITFFDPNASNVTQAIWHTGSETSSSQVELFNGYGDVASTTQYTGFSVYFNGTTIVSGNYILYGFKH
jgi:hypothetical protein